MFNIVIPILLGLSSLSLAIYARFIKRGFYSASIRGEIEVVSNPTISIGNPLEKIRALIERVNNIYIKRLNEYSSVHKSFLFYPRSYFLASFLFKDELLNQKSVLEITLNDLKYIETDLDASNKRLRYYNKMLEEIERYHVLSMVERELPDQKYYYLPKSRESLLFRIIEHLFFVRSQQTPFDISIDVLQELRSTKSSKKIIEVHSENS